jgi:hypothetical protein
VVVTTITTWTMKLLDGPGRELASVLMPARRQWTRGRRPVLAGVAALCCIAATASYSHPSLRPDVRALGAAQASLPLPVELARIPLSTFLPTIDLPLAAAVAQILVVVGLAELLLNRYALLALAAGSQVLATLSARVLIEIGTATGIGLPASQALALDTGPSVMTTAVGTWLLLRYRAHHLLASLTVALLISACWQNNIDGREHLAALLCGLAFAAAIEPARRLAEHVKSICDYLISRGPIGGRSRPPYDGRKRSPVQSSYRGPHST